MSVETPKPALKMNWLYLGDNGRCTCGLLGCAGMTAHYTGHDLSGQKMLRVTKRQIAEYNLRCEGCGSRGAL